MASDARQLALARSYQDKFQRHIRIRFFKWPILGLFCLLFVLFNNNLAEK